MKTHIKAGTRAAPTFSRYMRSLGADNQRRTLLGLVVAFAVLGAWGAWLFLARVTLYEVTTEARLEDEQAGYTVEAATAGRVVNTRLALGREVKAGDVLAELDTDEQQHRLEEEQARSRRSRRRSRRLHTRSPRSSRPSKTRARPTALRSKRHAHACARPSRLRSLRGAQPPRRGRESSTHRHEARTPAADGGVGAPRPHRQTPAREDRAFANDVAGGVAGGRARSVGARRRARAA